MNNTTLENNLNIALELILQNTPIEEVTEDNILELTMNALKAQQEKIADDIGDTKFWFQPGAKMMNAMCEDVYGKLNG